MVTIATINIDFGAKNNIDKLADLIIKSKAHIIGIQETRIINNSYKEKTILRNLIKCFDKTWKYIDQDDNDLYTGSVGLLTNLPYSILPNGLGIKVLYKDLYFYVVNVHLYPAPFPIFDIYGFKSKYYNEYSMTESGIIKLCKQKQFYKNKQIDRWNGIKWCVKNIKDALKNDVNEISSVFIMGDFNEPSHLDYTEKAVRSGIVPIKIKFPISSFLIKIGFIDVYRKINKNEVKDPGYTHCDEHAIPLSADVRKKYGNVIKSRIDYIYMLNLDNKLIPIKAKVIKAPFSDHNMVLCKLQK